MARATGLKVIEVDGELVAQIDDKRTGDVTDASPSVASASALAAEAATRAAADIDPLNFGYDLVLTLGQSNASGIYSVTGMDATKLDFPDPRVFQWGVSGSLLGVDQLATVPLLSHDNPSGISPAMEFGRLYAHSIPSNRRVLLVGCAHSGTKFEGYVPGSPCWRTDTPTADSLYENAITQATAALAANPNSRIVAMLWVQGEGDAGADVSGPTYQTDLDALITGLRSRLSIPTVPFIVGQMVPEYMAGHTRPAINAVHIDTPRRFEYAAFSYGAIGANQGDGNHYTATGQRINGRAMYDALLIAKTNIVGTAPVTPGAVTVAQSAANLNVSWVRPRCRATDYTVQYRVTGAGSWTTLTRSQSIDNTAVIPITTGTSYDVQIATVNEQGTSAYTTPVTLLTVVAPGQVTGLAAGTSLSSSVPLTWTATTGAATYKVEYKTSAGSTWTTFTSTATTPASTVTGLLSSTAYDFRVSAINGGGTGTVSSTVSSTTQAIQVLSVAVTATMAQAWSLRKVRAAWAGSCIQVRRDLDNTTQDIGFDAAGGVDQAAMLTFAAGSSLFVSKLYDQSGNTRDLIQATTTAQPRVCLQGVVDLVNGRPAMLFDGIGNYLSGAFAPLFVAGAASYLALMAATGGTNITLFNEGNTPGGYYTHCSGSGKLTAGAKVSSAGTTMLATASGGATAFDGTARVLSMTDTGTLLSNWVDANVSEARSYTRSAVTLTVTGLGALMRGTAANFLIGYVAEMVTYTSALGSTDRTNGQANLKAYYSTA